MLIICLHVGQDAIAEVARKNKLIIELMKMILGDGLIEEEDND